MTVNYVSFPARKRGRSLGKYLGVAALLGIGGTAIAAAPGAIRAYETINSAPAVIYVVPQDTNEVDIALRLAESEGMGSPLQRVLFHDRLRKINPNTFEKYVPENIPLRKGEKLAVPDVNENGVAGR